MLVCHAQREQHDAGHDGHDHSRRRWHRRARGSPLEQADDPRQRIELQPSVRTAERTRTEQMRQLQSYGWIDRDKGIIHVPIERAIDQLVSQKGKKQ